MSGGHFDYNQYRIGDIADQLEDELYPAPSDAEYSFRLCHSDDVKDKQRAKSEIEHAVKILRMAEVLAQRFDWWISADDGENTFYQRLEHDLKQRDLWDLYCKTRNINHE